MSLILIDFHSIFKSHNFLQVGRLWSTFCDEEVNSVSVQFDCGELFNAAETQKLKFEEEYGVMWNEEILLTKISQSSPRRTTLNVTMIEEDNEVGNGL